jgi:hypothetical protein
MQVSGSFLNPHQCTGVGGIDWSVHCATAYGELFLPNEAFA